MWRPYPTYARWHAKYGGVLALFLLAITAVTAIAVFVQGNVNQRQDRQRDVDLHFFATNNKNLLVCVSAWASELGASLPPVRAASVARDESVTNYRARQNETRRIDDRITDLFISAIAHPTTDPDVMQARRQRALSVFEAKAHAAREEADAYHGLKAAEDHLNTVRANNPYPATPEFACDRYLP